MKDKILITLATGTTGYAITQVLLAEGYPVRIYVRSRNKRALELEKIGAEIAFGTFDSQDQFRAALKGIKTAYFCYPMMRGMPESVELFIQAAQETSLDALVFMGQWLAEYEDAQSRLTLDVQASYALLKKSGLSVVYYNPGFFADNLISFPESVIQLGQMPSPFGEGLCPWISTGDLARVAAALLKNPAPYIGQKVHPTGPKSIGAAEMAAIYSKVAGRKVRVMEVSDSLFIKAVRASAAEFGYDNFVAVQTVLYNHELRKNRFAESAPTDVVKFLTGREPEDFETIVRQHFAASPYQERNLANWFHAIVNFFKLMMTRSLSKSEQMELNA